MRKKRIICAITAIIAFCLTCGPVFAQPNAGKPPVVIILPGIMGSELADAEGNTIWLPLDIIELSGLMALTGNQEMTQEMMDALMNTAEVQELLSKATANLGKLAFFEGESIEGIVPVQNYGTMSTYKYFADALSVYAETYVFCYDWRQENANSAEKLDEFLRQFEGRDITLIGHSMGGIVASEYMIAHPTDNGITNVITLGTPYLGAQEATNVLGSGNIFGGELAGPIGEIFASAISGVASTIPSMQELKPREKYDVPTNAPAGGWYAFYGTGIDTNGADGDGTVEANSATDGGSIANMIEFPNVAHNALVSNNAVISEIVAIMGAEPIVTPTHATTPTPSQSPTQTATPTAEITPVPPEDISPTPTTTPSAADTSNDSNNSIEPWIYIICGVALLAVASVIFIIIHRRARKKT